MDLFSFSLSRTFIFYTISVIFIFPILLRQHISNLSSYFFFLILNVHVYDPGRAVTHFNSFFLYLQSISDQCGTFTQQLTRRRFSPCPSEYFEDFGVVNMRKVSMNKKLSQRQQYQVTDPLPHLETWITSIVPSCCTTHRIRAGIYHRAAGFNDPPGKIL